MASIVESETGWRVITVEHTSSGHILKFHRVHSWGLLLDVKSGRSMDGKFIPLSMSGEILSEQEGFLGIVDPLTTDDEAVNKFTPEI